MAKKGQQGLVYVLERANLALQEARLALSQTQRNARRIERLRRELRSTRLAVASAEEDE